MNFLRQIVRDRISFSAISALFAVVLVLQGLSVGFAQGAMAAAAADPFNILCFAGDGTSVKTRTPADGPVKHSQCPCATLCQQSQNVVSAIPVFADASARPTGLWAAVEIIPDHLVPPAPSIGLVAEARAPPIVSVV